MAKEKPNGSAEGVVIHAALVGPNCISFDSDKAAKVKLHVDASQAPLLALLAMDWTEQDLEVTFRKKKGGT